ncbi:MAG: hypothetical protein C4310_11825, partial [Chloroflexota bacterium]
MNSARLRNGFVWLLILLAIGAILYSYRANAPAATEKPISAIAADVQAGRVKQIIVSGDELTVKYKDSANDVITYKGGNGTVEELLASYGVTA